MIEDEDFHFSFHSKITLHFLREFGYCFEGLVFTSRTVSYK